MAKYSISMRAVIRNPVMPRGEDFEHSVWETNEQFIVYTGATGFHPFIVECENRPANHPLLGIKWIEVEDA